MLFEPSASLIYVVEDYDGEFHNVVRNIHVHVLRALEF